MIDTGEGKDSWLRLLRSVLSSESTTVSHALLTHWHHDHVGGTGDLLSLCPSAKIHKYHPASGQEIIEDGQIFKTEGVSLRAVYCPGHTTDHVGFVLKEENAMFTGDNVLGHGTAVFENLVTYLDSLVQMRAQCGGRAYPGHGAVIDDGKGKISEYIEHRKQREEEMLLVLSQLYGDATPSEIVKIVYRDVPENLHEPAARGVIQMLQKLESEGKVSHNDSGQWRISEKMAL